MTTPKKSTPAKKAAPRKAVAKAAPKKAAPKAKVADTKHSRMSDAEVTKAIKAAVKADPTLRTSWSRCLRTLRANGAASASHLRFRDLFTAATK
jgi:hypothetical protein